MRIENVVNALNRLTAERGKPKRIYCGNGSDFAGRMLDLWVYKNKVELVFSRPAKPTDNAYIETFNGIFQNECFNFHWFDSLSDAKVKIEALVEGL